eukprot:scaffold160520_cov22-Prasinocladus_malaysianus.AAC.2
MLRASSLQAIVKADSSNESEAGDVRLYEYLVCSLDILRVSEEAVCTLPAPIISQKKSSSVAESTESNTRASTYTTFSV